MAAMQLDVRYVTIIKVITSLYIIKLVLKKL